MKSKASVNGVYITKEEAETIEITNEDVKRVFLREMKRRREKG